MAATHENSVTGMEPPRAGVHEQAVTDNRVTACSNLSHRFHELAKDYFLFSLAPMYTIARVDFDLLAQFDHDTRLKPLEQLITVHTAGTVLRDAGPWGSIVQGLPHSLRAGLVNFMLSAVFVTPDRYWRANAFSVEIPTPGELQPTRSPVAFFVPTGKHFAVAVRPNITGDVSLVQAKAEPLIINEEAAYRSSQLAKGTN